MMFKTSPGGSLFPYPYKNGELFNDQKFTEIRKIADEYLQIALNKK